jgi:hypothetical protein
MKGKAAQLTKNLITDPIDHEDLASGATLLTRNYFPERGREKGE